MNNFIYQTTTQRKTQTSVVSNTWSFWSKNKEIWQPYLHHIFYLHMIQVISNHQTNICSTYHEKAANAIGFTKICNKTDTTLMLIF